MWEFKVAVCVSEKVRTETIIITKISSLNEQSLIPGEKEFGGIPLINRLKVQLPLLHMKLRIIKNCLQYNGSKLRRIHVLEDTFPGISDAKIKEDGYGGPQIRELIQVIKLLRPAKCSEQSSI